ncbi:MAG: ArnT family glycosyltransferase [Phototrophicaceae bacterium]
MQKVIASVRFHHGLLLLIVVLGGALRLYRPAMMVLSHDEAWMLLAARNMVTGGEALWLAGPTTLSNKLFHSPLTIYINLPFMGFEDGVIFARLAVGVVGLLAILAAYVTGKHFGGGVAGVFAAALFAIMPYSVYFSRFMWNPNYVLPLLPLWLYTGSRGYLGDSPKGWAQTLHWVLLGFIIQFQVAYGVLVPLSTALVIYHLWKPSRWRVIRNSFMGGVMALLFAAPWIYGLSRLWLNTQYIPVETRGRQVHLPSLELVFTRFSDLISGTELIQGIYPYPYYEFNGIHNIDWAAALPLSYAISGVMATALLGLLVLDWRSRRFFYSVLVITAVYSLGYLLFEPDTRRTIRPDYLIPVWVATAIGVGVVLGKVWQRGRWGKVLSASFTVFYVTAMLALLISVGALFDFLGNRTFYRLGLDELLSIYDEWAITGADVIIIEPNHEQVTEEIFWIWLSVRGNSGLRLMRMSSTGLPIYADGTLIAYRPDYNFYDPLLTDLQPIGQYLDGSPIYKWQILTGDDLPAITDAAPAITYRDGAQLRGFVLPDALEAGTSVPFQLIWQTGQTKPDGIDKFSLRLIHAETGERYAQWDGVSLGATLWQADTTVLNSGEFVLSAAMPPDAPLAFEIIRYEEASGRTTHFTHPDGNPGGDVLRFALDIVQ